MTSSFGAVVLCELPDSVREQRKTELPRSMEGAYLHPAFGSKAHECIVSIDGECKRIRPKSIKLVVPLRWEFSLVRSLFVQTGEVVEHVKILRTLNSAQRVPNPFRAVNKQVTQGTKPSVLNSLVTRATLWLSNTKSHGLLKTKRLLYQLRIPDQKLFQTTSYATINDSDLSCS